ncbi:MAG: SdpI family protein [Clostridia bacterium]|nr:SdpI family protein [Clostridia bacterium]
MKKLYALNCIVVLLCIVTTAVLLVFTPDTIPAHYNFAGEVDRFGSKYENLIFPAITILVGAFFLLLAKQQRRKGEAVNEKILLYAGTATSLFLTALGLFFMVKAITYDPSAAASAGIDIIKFVSIAIGMLLVVLGNIMPKMRRNSLFGLRTKWSMANDDVWQRSQRFGGIASVLCGLVMIVAAIFVPGTWNALLMTVVILAWLTASVVASYRYYRADAIEKK